MWSRASSVVYSAGQLLRRYSSKSAEEIFREKLQKIEKKSFENAPEWIKREESLRKRYGQWNPTHKLSRQQIHDIRDLKLRMPELKTVQLADFFHINPESIRRILKSKWVPNEEELESLTERANNRKLRSQEKKMLLKQERYEERDTQKKKNEPVRTLPTIVIDSDRRKGPRNHHGGSGAKKQYGKSNNQEKRYSKHERGQYKPYTEGVGDLID